MCEINTNSQNTFEKKMDGIRRTGKEIIALAKGRLNGQFPPVTQLRTIYIKTTGAPTVVKFEIQPVILCYYLCYIGYLNHFFDIHFFHMEIIFITTLFGR